MTASLHWEDWTLDQRLDLVVVPSLSKRKKEEEKITMLKCYLLRLSPFYSNVRFFERQGEGRSLKTQNATGRCLLVILASHQDTNWSERLTTEKHTKQIT